MAINKNGSTPQFVNASLVPSAGFSVRISAGQSAGSYVPSGFTLEAGLYSFTASTANKFTLAGTTPGVTAGLINLTSASTALSIVPSASYLPQDTPNFAGALVDSAPSATEKFVAVRNTVSSLASSTDGVTWTTQSAPGPIWKGLAAADTETNKYVAVASGAIGYSTDGITWTTAPVAHIGSDPRVVHNGSTFVLISVGNSAFLSSTDGVTWTTRTNPDGITTYAIGTNDGGTEPFLIGGASGLLRTSTNGITWVTRTTGSVQTTYGIGGGGGLVFVGYGNGQVYKSTDGITWTIDAGLAGVPYSIGYASTGAYKYFVQFSNQYQISTDGTTWSQLIPTTSYSITTQSGRTFAFDGTTYVIASNSKMLYSSAGQGAVNPTYLLSIVGPLPEQTLTTS